MKQSEIGPAVMAGEKVMVGEFRDWQCDERESTKKPGTFNVFLKTFVVIGRDTVEVTAFAERGQRKADVKRPAWKVGDRVVIKFTAYSRTQYGLRCDGQVEGLQPG
jgi:hypothetical protein